ncbi:beta-lactamase family protein [Flavihumibacter rivuli]|uniref:serine hydrolase domain-containing protein n=1 Tax=Flavihumibacter rivuli TaxID=2838156 RepID=UPI001BDF06C8|nr:serine hydrolase domain-containing protein [Flavihumibacter rivuli]ULQ55490.1 beta-lactamase family protein [Flavihumibacter rivuli]
MKPFLCFLALLCAYVSNYAQITKDNVDSLVKAAVDSVRIAGATVLVAKGDEIIHHKGYGYAHIGFKVPATTDTRYFIVGPNGTLLAGIVMHYVEQKKFSLDDKVLRYLPKLPSAYEAITIRHLLTCTSGIPDYHYLGDRYDGSLGQPHTTDEVMARFIDLPLSHPPGTRFEWSISNFLILTMLLEEVAGKPYRDILKEFIAPLKINSTAVIDPVKSIDHFAPGYMYQLERQELYPAYQSVLNYDPSLRIYSTAGDWFEMWKGLKNARLISKESFALMTSKEEAKRNKNIRFGYLILLSEFSGKDIYHFNGALPGYSSYFSYVPAEDITIIVFSNTGNVQEADQIGGMILHNIVKVPTFPFKVPKDLNYASIAVPKDSMTLLTGTFHLRRQLKGGNKGPASFALYKRTIRVFIENDQLMIQQLGELPSPLLKQKDGSYRIVGALPQASLRFVFDNGKIKSIVREYDGQPVEEVGERIGDADARTFHKSLID